MYVYPIMYQLLHNYSSDVDTVCEGTGFSFNSLEELLDVTGITNSNLDSVGSNIETRSQGVCTSQIKVMVNNCHE